MAFSFLLWPFLISILLAYGITMLVEKIVCAMGILAPTIQHPRQEKVPTLGGVAIYTAFVLAYFLAIPSSWHLYDRIYIVVGMGLMLGVGILDDVLTLKPWQKTIGILISATWLYFLTDMKLESVNLLYFGEIRFGILEYPVTMLWFFICTNAINLIDGLDGLAAGVSSISLVSMILVSAFFTRSNYWTIALFMMIYLGSLLGFLGRNSYPARIFMGDSGALLTGYTIALLSLRGLKNATFFSLLIPITLLAVPFTDTFAAFFRRVLSGVSFTTRDHNHFHHRLLKIGYSHRRAVWTIYGLAILASVATTLLHTAESFWQFVMLIALAFYYIWFVIRIRNKAAIYTDEDLYD